MAKGKGVGMAGKSKESRIASELANIRATKGWTREELAAKVGLTLATSNRALAGTISLATLRAIEKAFPGIGELPVDGETGFGGYSREQADRYVGRYVLVSARAEPGVQIQAWPVEIVWDREVRALKMRSMRSDGAAGFVDMPESSHQLFVSWRWAGWPTLLALSRMPLKGEAIMRGIFITVVEHRSLVVLPVFLKRDDGLTAGEGPPKVGIFRGRPGERFYKAYCAELEKVDLAQSIGIGTLPWLKAASPK